MARRGRYTQPPVCNVPRKSTFTIKAHLFSFPKSALPFSVLLNGGKRGESETIVEDEVKSKRKGVKRNLVCVFLCVLKHSFY